MFHIEDIQNILRIESAEKQDLLFNKVCIDSRLFEKDDLFFALPGEKVDGHHFLSTIAEKDGKVAVVNINYEGPDFGLYLLKVQDPKQALQTLAKEKIQKKNPRIVAVTGSVGKTTTKDFIATLLKEKYRVASSPGNSNSQLGLPLAILNHYQDEEILVLEMGMTHKGHIEKLIEIAPPECAVITTVALVHACNFSSLEEIALTKAEILKSLKTKLGIIHRDISNFSAIKESVSFPIKSFSLFEKQADYTPLTSTIDLSLFPIKGDHYLSNFLAAIACADYFLLNDEEIKRGMQKIVLPALRGQRIEKNGVVFINDAYNAAPISVKAALSNLPLPKNAGRKIAVLSDMLELGEFSQKSHLEIAEFALNHVDLLFCYGTECRYILDCWQGQKRTAYWFFSRKELVDALQKILQKDDVVLIKGSRSTEIAKVVDELNW